LTFGLRERRLDVRAPASFDGAAFFFAGRPLAGRSDFLAERSRDARTVEGRTLAALLARGLTG
jgi:hypothetical protein